MDPNATLLRILNAADKDEAKMACDDLWNWLTRGGYAPTVPAGTRYWPGTGTSYGILSPAPFSDTTWVFVLYDTSGERVAEYALPHADDQE